MKPNLSIITPNATENDYCGKKCIDAFFSPTVFPNAVIENHF